MLRTIILQPLNRSKSAIVFPGSFYDNTAKANVHLLINFKLAIGRDPSKDEKLYDVIFDGTKNNIEIKFDDQIAEQAKWVNYLKRHPLVKFDGNTNLLATPYFELIDIAKDIEKNVRTNKFMQIVANKVAAMTINDMKDLAYLFGQNVTSLTAEQIYLKLCSVVPGTELGILMKDPEGSLRMFGNPDKEVIVNVQKAIALNIIESRMGLYYVGQEQVGKTVGDAVDYFKKNNKLYEGYVVRELGIKDELPIGSTNNVEVEELLNMKPEKTFVPKEAAKSKEDRNAEKEMKEREIHDEEMARQDELRPLRDKARELGVRGWQLPTMTKEILERKIEEAAIENKQKELTAAGVKIKVSA